ncbi:MAG: hypothetical protein E6Q36_07925 [Chryseobacterium sp.]|nr:MAG: hypothetical protein E6Q36_07925 [Chryseobacterium sp.]
MKTYKIVWKKLNSCHENVVKSDCAPCSILIKYFRKEAVRTHENAFNPPVPMSKSSEKPNTKDKMKNRYSLRYVG